MSDQILFWGIVLFLLATLGIGVWASSRIKGDSVNFLAAGRGLVSWLTYKPGGHLEAPVPEKAQSL
jgi:Na+/proline symporter